MISADYVTHLFYVKPIMKCIITDRTALAPSSVDQPSCRNIFILDLNYTFET